VSNNVINAIDPSGLASLCFVEVENDEDKNTQVSDFIKFIKRLNTARKWKNAFKNPKQINHIDAVMKRFSLKGLAGNEIIAIIKALQQFAPKTNCGRWYKATYQAILNAGTKCNRSHCQVINKGLITLNGVAGNCLSDIGGAAGGQAAFNFVKKANELATACGNVADKSKNCRS